MQQATDFFEEPLRNSLHLSAGGLFSSLRPPEQPSLTDPQLELENSLGYDTDNSEFTAALISSTNLGRPSTGADDIADPGTRKNGDALCLLEREISRTILYTLAHPDRNIPQLGSNLSLSFTDLIDEPDELRSILETAHSDKHHEPAACNDAGTDDKTMPYAQGNFYIMGDQMLFQDAFDYDDHSKDHARDKLGDDAFDTLLLGDGINGPLTSWMVEGMDQEPLQTEKTPPQDLSLGPKLQYYTTEPNGTYFGEHDIFDGLDLPMEEDRTDLDHDGLDGTDIDLPKSQHAPYVFELKPRLAEPGSRGFEAAGQALNYDMSASDYGGFYDPKNEPAKYGKLDPDPHTDGKRYIKSSILKWAYNELEPLVTLNDMQLEITGLDPLKVSNSVKRTIEKELQLQDQYLAAVMQGRRTLHLMKPRRRRNPTCDDLTWIPVSLYQAAYTNIKIHPLEKTDYSNEIPNELCFGKVNMRVKRAWLRGPNKQKLLMMRSLMQQGMIPDKEELQFEVQDDGECLDYFLFQM